MEGIQEQWRDHRIWLLAGLGEILDIKCFYYHLKETCSATDEEVKNIKDLLKKLQRTAWELIDYLNLCSPLGPLFVQMKQSGLGKGVGRNCAQSFEKTEDQESEDGTAPQSSQIANHRKDQRSLAPAYRATPDGAS